MFRRATPPILGRDRRPVPGSVARLERMRIGGVEQWTLQRGVDTTQPILLLIPDGPGATLIPLAHSFQRELERAFVVVNWDPRGSGLSEGPMVPTESLTIEQLTLDTLELARQLSERYGRERIVLAGHGFGSVVGLLAAARAPERFEAYIGVGQWVEPIESERRCLAWARSESKRLGRDRLVRRLEALPDPGPEGPERTPVLDGALRALGAVFVNPEGPRRATPSWVRTPEYTLLDHLVRRPRGIARSRETVGREVWRTDLVTRVTRVGVPTFFLAGRSDHVVDPELAREYLRVLDAPQKGWAWIEETAHLAPFEDPDAYAAALAHYAQAARDRPGPQWAIAG